MKILQKYKIMIVLFTIILLSFLFLFKDIYRSLSYENRNFIKKIFLSEREILLKPLKKNQLTLPNTYFTQIFLEKINIPNSYNTLNSRNKAVGYLEEFDNWVFFISGTGKILKIKTWETLILSY